MKLDFSEIAAIKALPRQKDAPWKKSIHNFVEFYLSSEANLIQRTSGSTGKPKEISLTKEVLNASAHATINFFQLKQRSSALLCIPAEYIGGKMMVVRAALGNWKLTSIEPKIQLQIPEGAYDFAAMIPAQVQYLLEEDLPALLRIKNLIIGGAAVSKELENNIYKANITAYSTYGMTETASHVALKKLDNFSNFKALNGIEFQVDSENCLLISGERIPNSPIKTNDVVELISNSEFKWKGRIDNVINSGGVKILVEELEAEIALFLKCPFYIKKSPHPKFGETPVLVVESKLFNEKEKSDLLALLKSKLSAHHTPSQIISKSEFKYTESGKILRI